MIGKTTALTAALIATVLAATAQSQPLFQPSRDVAVTYHVDNTRPGDHRSDTVRMYFTDAGTKIRIEPTGQPNFSIVDRTAGRMTIVMQPQHMYMDMLYDPKRIMTFDTTGATLSRIGSDTVAGISCTVYEAQREGHSGKVCISSDGMLLRAKSDDPGQPNGGLEAVSVAYGPQSADLFAPPPGYQKMDIAAMAHGMPMPPPNR